MKKSTIGSLILIFLMIPATLYLGSHLKGRWYYLTCTLMVIETMIPFFLVFESRKPQARELVTLAVMTAIAVVSRLVIIIPNFKPITGVIMITGIALGAEAGFVCGALGAFVSNFFVSQGPWTPWQMMAYGFGGFLAGLIFHRSKMRNPIVLAVFGFVSIQCVVGPLLDTCTVFTTGAKLTRKFVLAVYASGVMYNFRHAIACAATLLVFSKPLLKKLNRLKVKYGMMEAGLTEHET